MLRYSILQPIDTNMHFFLPPQEMAPSSTTRILLPKMADSADNEAMEEVMAQKVADTSSTNSIVVLDDGSSHHQKENTSTLNPNNPKTLVHASANSVKKETQYQDDKVSAMTVENDARVNTKIACTCLMSSSALGIVKVIHCLCEKKCAPFLATIMFLIWCTCFPSITFRPLLILILNVFFPLNKSTAYRFTTAS